MFSWFLESEHQARKDAVDQLILDVHSRCIRNREALQRVDRCGCFYCLAIFDPQEIEEWIEDEGGDTALCPRCEIDSVPPRIGRLSSGGRFPAPSIALSTPALAIREFMTLNSRVFCRRWVTPPRAETIFGSSDCREF